MKKSSWIAAVSLTVCLVGNGLLAAAPPLPGGPAPQPEAVADLFHTASLAWYGMVNMLGLAVMGLVRREMNRALPRCLIVAAIGAGCWLVGLASGANWLMVVGIILLSLAHVCECTFHFRRLLRRSLRSRMGQ